MREGSSSEVQLLCVTKGQESEGGRIERGEERRREDRMA